jgi:hypothetical protein
VNKSGFIICQHEVSIMYVRELPNVTTGVVHCYFRIGKFLTTEMLIMKFDISNILSEFVNVAFKLFRGHKGP